MQNVLGNDQYFLKNWGGNLPEWRGKDRKGGSRYRDPKNGKQNRERVLMPFYPKFYNL